MAQQGVDREQAKRTLSNTGFAELTSLRAWPVVEARLREGASPGTLASYIQEEMGEMTHIKHSSLRRRLYRYKDRVLMPKQALSATYIDTMIQNMETNIDDVEELTRLILVQKLRVSKDLELEQNMPKLAGWLTKEIQLLFDMIERRAKLMQTLGHLYKAPEKHLVGVVGDESWAQIMNSLDDDQRERAREIVQTEYAMQREQTETEQQESRGMISADPSEVESEP